MDKYRLTFILFCLTFYTYGQKSISVYEYRYPEDWISVSLTLTSENTFIWKSCNGYGDLIASGTYKRDKSKLTLVPKNAYRFQQDALRELISHLVIDSCCNLTILKDGITTTQYKQTFYNSQYKADSCILKNMSCILDSPKLSHYNKRFGFTTEFKFTNLLVKDDQIIVLSNKETKWILSRRK